MSSADEEEQLSDVVEEEFPERDELQRYLAGGLKAAYCLNPTLRRLLENSLPLDIIRRNIEGAEAILAREGFLVNVPEDRQGELLIASLNRIQLCRRRCILILSAYTTRFESFKHGGHKRAVKLHNNLEKIQNRRLGKDWKAQSEFLRTTVFDSRGNPLFCYNCVTKCFGITKKRLTSLKKKVVSLQTSSHIFKAKRDINLRELDIVSLPIDSRKSPLRYFVELDADAIVPLKNNALLHGLSLRDSNRKKERDHFRAFVESIRQPTGRQEQGGGIRFYFNAKYTRLESFRDLPRRPIGNLTEAERRQSVVYDYNRIQADAGRPSISDSTFREWLKDEYPDTRLFPVK